MNLMTPAKAKGRTEKYGQSHLLWGICKIARERPGDTAIEIGVLANVLGLTCREVEELTPIHLSEFVNIEARADLYQIRVRCGYKFHSRKGIANT